MNLTLSYQIYKVQKKCTGSIYDTLKSLDVCIFDNFGQYQMYICQYTYNIQQNTVEITSIQTILAKNFHQLQKRQRSQFSYQREASLLYFVYQGFIYYYCYHVCCMCINGGLTTGRLVLSILYDQFIKIKKYETEIGQVKPATMAQHVEHPLVVGEGIDSNLGLTRHISEDVKNGSCCCCVRCVTFKNALAHYHAQLGKVVQTKSWLSDQCYLT